MTRDTVGGIPVVRNEGSPPNGRLVPVTTVPAADSGPTAFGRIVSVVLGENGSVYAADRMQNAIIEVDSAGHLVRTIGRKGHGPGEFEMLYSLAWLGDTLAAYDPGNTRTGLMATDGQWVGQRTSQPITGSVRLQQIGPAEFLSPIAMVDTANHKVHSAYVSVTASASATSDTLRTSWGRLRQPPGTMCTGGGGFSYHEYDFNGHPLVTFVRGPLEVTAWSADYRLTFLNAALDTALIVERVRTPLPLADSGWAAWLAEFHAWKAKLRGAKCDPAGDPPRPAHRPAMREIFGDRNGDLWVEASAPAGFAFDDFANGDSLRAEYPAPANRDRNVVPYVRDGRIALVTRDSLGVQTVRVYRFDRGTP